MSESKWREALAEVLAAHRVNYHHHNVGPEPVTADNLRYTSCEGCDWLGGHRDEAGWESHLADALSPVLAQMKREWQAEAREEERERAKFDDEVRREQLRMARAEALREAADDGEVLPYLVRKWLRDRAAALGEPTGREA